MFTDLFPMASLLQAELLVSCQYFYYFYYFLVVLFLTQALVGRSVAAFILQCSNTELFNLFQICLLFCKRDIKWFSMFIFDNDRTKTKWIWLNNGRDDVKGIIQKYSPSLRRILISYYYLRKNTQLWYKHVGCCETFEKLLVFPLHFSRVLQHLASLY